MEQYTNHDSPQWEGWHRGIPVQNMQRQEEPPKVIHPSFSDISAAFFFLLLVVWVAAMIDNKPKPRIKSKTILFADEERRMPVAVEGTNIEVAKPMAEQFMVDFILGSKTPVEEYHKIVVSNDKEKGKLTEISFSGKNKKLIYIFNDQSKLQITDDGMGSRIFKLLMKEEA